MKKLLLFTAASAVSLCGAAETLDFDKIVHWAGEGPNKAALVLSPMPRAGQPDPGSPVWGFRWADGETPSGFDMLCAVASASRHLAVLVQFTGDMGYTLDGAGYSPDAAELISNLVYDFDGAAADEHISFGFYTPNKSMKQTSAPGGDTPALVSEAIDEGKGTHVVMHPLNAEVYGYPAYDYDWWSLDSEACPVPAKYYWNAGWYNGYWSYWLGDADLDNFAYSGLGMSSVELHDGDVHGWKYNDFGGASSDEWSPLDYTHAFASTTGIDAVGADSFEAQQTTVYYRLDGRRLPQRPDVPGFYIVVSGSESSKIMIK